MSQSSITIHVPHARRMLFRRAAYADNCGSIEEWILKWCDAGLQQVGAEDLPPDDPDQQELDFAIGE